MRRKTIRRKIITYEEAISLMNPEHRKRVAAFKWEQRNIVIPNSPHRYAMAGCLVYGYLSCEFWEMTYDKEIKAWTHADSGNMRIELISKESR